MADAVRDVLDKQLRGRHRQRLGRVDGLVVELRDDEPPRLAYLELGAVTLARRLHPRLAGWVARLQRWCVQSSSRPIS